MKLFLASLVTLGATFNTHAQSSRAFTIVVKSERDIIKLLIEKKADLTIALVSGTFVTLADSSESLSATTTPNFAVCSPLGHSLVSCPADFKLENEKPASNERLKRALGGIHAELLLSPEAAAQPASLNPLGEIVFWWSVQASNVPADFDDYLKRYPNGEYYLAALARLADLRPEQAHPLPIDCDTSDAAILLPVQQLIEALNERDLGKFLRPWATYGIFRSYDGRVTYRVKESVGHFRGETPLTGTRIFRLISWRVSLEPDGSANVRDAYSVMTEVNGVRSESQDFESYKLVCANDHQWAITENIDFLR